MKKTLVFSALLLSISLSESSLAKPVVQTVPISGTVTDINHEPIPGATILVIIGDSVVTGTSTNPDGTFTLKVPDTLVALLKVSAVGCVTWSRQLTPFSESPLFDICLEQIEIPLPAISVSPENESETSVAEISADEVSSRAHQSIVSSNPIAAIRSPQVVRRGSQHSSNLRINGTSPTFYLNGSKIGFDPNHYGAFSIIPSGIVDGMKVHPQGTSARHNLPSVVELNTSTPFNKGFSGEANLSVIASDGYASIGNSKFFLTTSARKSVIDQFADKINSKSEKQTIPPTIFQDLFATGGVMLSPSSRIIVDAYHVQDYLSLESEIATGRAGGISTFLHTSESFAAGRYEGLHDNWLVKVAASARSSYETYQGFSRSNYGRGLQLDLTEKSVTTGCSIDVTRSEDAVDISAGIQGEYVPSRRTDLHQRNWNFQPPDASSDLPSLYQPELNARFGDYHASKSSSSRSGYVSFKERGEKLSFEHGLRVDHFANLFHPTAFSVRNQLRIVAPYESTIDFHFGVYAESPVNRILESWQPIIRSEETHLQPIRTTLTSITVSNRGLSIGAFTKRMDQVPVVIPPLVSMSGLLPDDDGQIHVKSLATQTFVGWDVSYNQPHFISDHVSMYGYYIRSSASRRVSIWEVPHELDIPHRFFASLDYTGAGKWSFGAEVRLQSGAPYTPAPDINSLTTLNPATAYMDQVLKENSMRLPYNASLNIRAQRTFSHGALYFSISNVTNRKNAIIHSYNGYIYDAGILPGIGFSYRW